MLHLLTANTSDPLNDRLMALAQTRAGEFDPEALLSGNTGTHGPWPIDTSHCDSSGVASDFQLEAGGEFRDALVGISSPNMARLPSRNSVSSTGAHEPSLSRDCTNSVYVDGIFPSRQRVPRQPVQQ